MEYGFTILRNDDTVLLAHDDERLDCTLIDQDDIAKMITLIFYPSGNVVFGKDELIEALNAFGEYNA